MRRILILLPWVLLSTSQAAMTHNRLAANRLAANRLAGNRLAANRLAASKLTVSNLGANLDCSDGSLASTPDGREVLTYIIGCALPEGTRLVATCNGTQYEFFGELGLTPRWIDHRLNKKGEGWVSNHNVAVPVSLRGDNAELTVSPDEAANWTVEEGAFYGQYFTPDPQPIDWIACRGRDNAAAVNVDRDGVRAPVMPTADYDARASDRARATAAGA